MPDPYEHKEFPKMVYFENGSNRVVNNEDELVAAQGEGAKASPADFGRIETEDAADKQRQAKAKADEEARARPDAEAKAKADADEAERQAAAAKKEKK